MTDPRHDGVSAEVHRLVSRHPFCQMVAQGPAGPASTYLPGLLVADDQGEPRFLGHLARANPLVPLLDGAPEVLALFLGAQGYVSPSWLLDRIQAPTWNYEAAQFRLSVNLDFDEAACLDAVTRITQHMEDDGDESRSVAEMGRRAVLLLGRIVVVNGEILEASVTSKLGESEADRQFEEVSQALTATGREDLAAAMLVARRQHAG